MRKSQRKFVGAILMLAFVIVYALIGMVICQALIVHGTPAPLQFFCYAVIGTAWVLPMMPLIAWMERPD